MPMQRWHTTVREQLLDGLPLQARRRELDGITTVVLEGGDGPPLVLLHGGIRAGGVIWWRVLPRLASTNRLVVPDLPGLGESAPAARLDSGTLAAWLAALIQATCEEPPTLVAHSPRVRWSPVSRSSGALACGGWCWSPRPGWHRSGRPLGCWSHWAAASCDRASAASRG
jgi:alpha/beta hydrolase fold